MDTDLTALALRAQLIHNREECHSNVVPFSSVDPRDLLQSC